MDWPSGVPPKPELRTLLLRAHPWLDDDRFGPRNVEAGGCDRCGAEPRLAGVCGPGPWTALGRACAVAEGAAAWCDGHADEAAAALAWLRALPEEADDVAWLWWLATGEIRPSALAEVAVGAVEVDQRFRARAVHGKPGHLADDE